MRTPKRLLALLLSFCLFASLFPYASAFSYDDMSQRLSVGGYEITTVAPGAQYISLSAYNASGKQGINAIEFDPKNPYTQLRAGKSQGYVWSTQTVNTIASNMSNTNGGDVAVAAINGDFFTFGVGVPHGIFIEDGIILSTPPQYYAAFGLTYDNEPFIVRHGTILDKEFRINGSLVNIAGINMAHTSGAESIMLYTADYARGTKTGAETYELRCRVNSGEVRHGGTLNFTVEEINDAVGNTTLGEGYIVLSAQGTNSIQTLKQLLLGDTLEMSFRFNEFWSNVKFAVGGIELLLKDGEVYSTTEKTNQPRTSIGIRADGSVVMATFDGRGAGGAQGMSYQTAAEAMLALGCVDALNLDGGGSTTFVLRTPGAMSTKVVNEISGSSPRQVANALVLMNTAPTLSPTFLSVSPKTKLCFAGGTYGFSVVSAYDENYKPHPVSSSLVWETDSELGIINENGALTALSAGELTVTARGDGAVGTAKVEIVDRVDAIKVSQTEISVKPGDTFELSASATLSGKAVEASSELFLWEADASLGKFTEPGKFKVSNDAVSGKITVSLGGVSTTVAVTVDVPPVVITGFEDNSVSFVPVSVGTKVAPSVKLESVLQYAHTGNRSLKTYYNFLGASGPQGSYFIVASDSKNSSAFYLRRVPKQLGMMVYGDGSGVELRSVVKEISGKQHTISYGKIDHTGWKYMTANVPRDISQTIYVKIPVYLVSNPENPTEGVLYFDGLTAIYDEKELDTTSPEITEVLPGNGEKVLTPSPTVEITLSDATGVDSSSIELYIDGNLCGDVAYNTASGKISHTITQELKRGSHSIMLFVRDKLGNPVFHKSFFEV